MSLWHLLISSQRFPTLLNIPLQVLSLYVTLVHYFKPQIAMTQHSTQLEAPEGLPTPLHEFLCQTLGLDHYNAQTCWTVLKDVAWEDQEHVSEDWNCLLPLFLLHGLCASLFFIFSRLEAHITFDTSYSGVFPPVCKCFQAHCPNNPDMCLFHDAPDLGEPCQIQAVLFSKMYGPVPVSAMSTYCRGIS